MTILDYVVIGLILASWGFYTWARYRLWQAKQHAASLITENTYTPHMPN